MNNLLVDGLMLLAVFGVVSWLGADITEHDTIKNESIEQCQEALDSNFTMKKGANGWKCVAENGIYKPEIHLNNVPEYPIWVDLAIIVGLALLIILLIPYLPRYSGGRL